MSERDNIMFFLCLTSALENTPPTRQFLQELIRRVGEGDCDALAQLYEETRAAVYGFVLSILKNKQDAEDALQEVFLAIDQNAARYQPHGSPMGWIMTIAKNTALAAFRKQSRVVAVEEPPETAEPAPAHSADDRMVLEAALEILSGTERQVVMLHAVAGLKHREIARLMDMSLSGALSKYHRALAKLREYLEGGEV